MKKFSYLYDDNYYKNRHKNDPKRLASFRQEAEFILKHIPLSGTVCDVGCSTGEFLESINWRGRKFGMEINKFAIDVAIKSGISFEKSILTEEDFFDVVIFRGTIQLLTDPFLYIGAAHKSLKKGGVIIFLATPNVNSIVYKIFNDLPAAGGDNAFYIPSDITLSNVLKNYDLNVLEIEYPYLKSPYANPFWDHMQFITCLFTRKRPQFAFWRNMMNLIAIKD